MSVAKGNILLTNPLQPPSATWKWNDQSKGLVEWIYTNPNDKQVSAILVRGVEQNGQVTEIYPFANAFWPLYWKNFGTQFLTSQPAPLVDNGVDKNQAPLGIVQDENGKKFVAFIFTLAPGQSWSMLEGGFLNCQPAAISMFVGVYNQTSDVTIKYNRVQQCSQYNLQAGTNFACPKNPIKVESAIFSITSNVKPLIPDPIKLLKQSGKKTNKNWIKLEKAFKKGDVVNFIKALRNLLGL